jgi:hypothetical protein
MPTGNGAIGPLLIQKVQSCVNLYELRAYCFKKKPFINLDLRNFVHQVLLFWSQAFTN